MHDEAHFAERVPCARERAVVDSHRTHLKEKLNLSGAD
jgi:hypothetical protein